MLSWKWNRFGPAALALVALGRWLTLGRSAALSRLAARAPLVAFVALTPSLSACGNDGGALYVGAGGGGGSGGGGSGVYSASSTGGMAPAPLYATAEDIAVLTAIAKMSQAVVDNPDVWPGYDFADMPIFAVRPGERALLVRHPQPPAELQPLSGLGAFLSDTLGDVYLAEPYADLLLRGQAFRIDAEVDGTLGFAIGYPLGENVLGVALPADVEERLVAMMTVHEMFHMHQLADWVEAPEQSLCAFPLDESMLGLAWVEQLALASALTAADPTADLSDFVVARLLRNSAQPSVQTAEDYWDRVEGTATFIETAWMERAGYIGSAKHAIVSDLVDEGLVITQLGRDRHYGTGSALAAILDHAGVPFREEVAMGQSLSAIAAEVVGVDSASAPLSLPALMAKYDFEETILPATQVAKTNYENLKTALVDAYDDSTNPLITFDFAEAGSSSFSKEDTVTLDDCSQLFSNVSWHINSPDLEAATGELDVLRYQPTPGQLHLSFRAAARGPFTIDGSELSWQAGSYPFDSLAVNTGGWSVSTARPGTLLIEDEAVTITVSATSP